ncbi:dehydrogenase [Prevotella sp. PMUR]|uniref:Dehydrogenase n=1 Tax=Xylanibacter muris TaxID=2736290 RepID=A0ABX2AMV2_9BACT|nr:dehydrogenase [Xylanibacter muris]NPD92248.1 dehydrogenase [Xylanibacter muris]
MADNYLEKHREEYEKRKARYLLRKRHIKPCPIHLQKPEDEAL